MDQRFASRESASPSRNESSNICRLRIGTEDKAAFLEVLDWLASDLEQAVDVGSDIKRKLQELIPEAAAQLKKDRPALIKVKSLLQGIATTIQTLGSMQPAYQTLKVALVPLGISLP